MKHVYTKRPVAPMQFEAGELIARVSRAPNDIRAAQAFRADHFSNGGSEDADLFDQRFFHVLIEQATDRRLVGYFRLGMFETGAAEASYSGQFYDLTALRGFPGRTGEIGRFCADPARRDPDILRLAWAVIAAIVEACDLRLLFGCSTFTGIDPHVHAQAFALLNAGHLAPTIWRPGIGSAQIWFLDAAEKTPKDTATALKSMPPLLRTYLAMGGWVSDHAVIDRTLGTLHVFTGVEVARIPAARKRWLQGLLVDAPRAIDVREGLA